MLDCRLRHAGKTPANFLCPQGGTDRTGGEGTSGRWFDYPKIR
ncbi:hypothetical protein HMPREF1548_04815 [Clostridium sp. KLE 1755]|nr:hypothetical protein HMPREF1548_04815 [Clostridium sp. KLE 1755]